LQDALLEAGSNKLSISRNWSFTLLVAWSSKEIFHRYGLVIHSSLCGRRRHSQAWTGRSSNRVDLSVPRELSQVRAGHSPSRVDLFVPRDISHGLIIHPAGVLVHPCHALLKPLLYSRIFFPGQGFDCSNHPHRQSCKYTSLTTNTSILSLIQPEILHPLLPPSRYLSFPGDLVPQTHAQSHTKS